MISTHLAAHLERLLGFARIASFVNCLRTCVLRREMRMDVCMHKYKSPFNLLMLNQLEFRSALRSTWYP